jgi:hypothetical protein
MPIYMLSVHMYNVYRSHAILVFSTYSGAALCSKLYRLEERNVRDLTVILEKGGNSNADVKEMIHG